MSLGNSIEFYNNNLTVDIYNENGELVTSWGQTWDDSYYDWLPPIAEVSAFPNDNIYLKLSNTNDLTIEIGYYDQTNDYPLGCVPSSYSVSDFKDWINSNILIWNSAVIWEEWSYTETANRWGSTINLTVIKGTPSLDNDVLCIAVWSWANLMQMQIDDLYVRITNGSSNPIWLRCMWNPDEPML